MALPEGHGDGSKSLTFTNLEELESLAKAQLPPKVFGYYASGAESESTVKYNRESFGRYRLLPTVMVDVSKMDVSATLFGKRLSFPVLIAPMAMQKMAHPDGELAVVRAAAKAGIGMVQSTMGTVHMDNVAKAGRDVPLLMFQLYVIKERDYTQKLIEDAERVGYHALMVTVDAPQLGNREADVKNSFKLPDGLTLENLVALGKRDLEINQQRPGSGIAQTFASHIDASLTWEFVAWVRSITRLPILVKGVLSPKDALRAVDSGVDGIVVSNHGGRQLDFSPAAFDMLPAVARVVGGRVPILVDGGVRRGTDIIKALAMGANGVLLGRPVLYGLTLGGQAGGERVLSILKREFELSMALLGCPTIGHLNRSMIVAPWEHPSRM